MCAKLAADTELVARVDEYLRLLTVHPDRHVGGSGNRAATALFAEVMMRLGLAVQRTELPCVEWLPDEASLEAGGEHFALNVGPYSLACDVAAPLVSVSNIEELEREATRGAIVLMHGQIAAGQVMPRNFTFYNPESHKRVIRALDRFEPAGIVAATGRDPQMVGSQYPFPLFEDGDLNVPNAYMTDVDGDRVLAANSGPVRLRIVSERVPASAEHLVAATPGAGAGRVVVTAHIDSRRGSPGALDNATGVATLLAVAELLADYDGSLTVEFVPFNGEDDYANPGEMAWIAENEGRFGEIVLGINIDDSGQRGAGNHVSFYDCPPDIGSAVREAMASHGTISEGPQWFQGDHAMLAMYGRPAIAIASAEIQSFMANFAHSERDTLELADSVLVASTAVFIADVIRRIGRPSDSPFHL